MTPYQQVKTNSRPNYQDKNLESLIQTRTETRMGHIEITVRYLTALRGDLSAGFCREGQAKTSTLLRN